MCKRQSDFLESVTYNYLWKLFKDVNLYFQHELAWLWVIKNLYAIIGLVKNLTDWTKIVAKHLQTYYHITRFIYQFTWGSETSSCWLNSH